MKYWLCFLIAKSQKLNNRNVERRKDFIFDKIGILRFESFFATFKKVFESKQIAPLRLI